MTGTVLILGAGGRFGRHAAEAFWNRGWRVRIFDRSLDRIEDAARGVDVIVNGWNPTYPEWEATVPKLTNDVIAAAKLHGATVIIPGNVYVFGVNARQLLDEHTPHSAGNRLGRVRIEMEAAYRASGVQTIVLRAGDFIDTEPSGNWFDHVITARSKNGVFVSPGDDDALHAWAWLPDLARAAVLLAEQRERLSRFEDVPFPGYSMSLRELSQIVELATGRKQTMRNMPWWALRLASPFWPMARGLLEMRYLWSKPHRLDGAKFERLLSGFRPTPPMQAISSLFEEQVHPDQSMAGRLSHMPAE